MNEELLTKLKHKNEAHEVEADQMAQEEYGDTEHAGMDQEIQNPPEVESDKRHEGQQNSFYRSISKRKTKENVDLLLHGNGDLETENMEKAEVSSACIALVLYQ